MTSKRKLWILFISFSLFPIAGGAATCTDPTNEWTGGTNQNWNNAGNWSTCIPGTSISNQDIANFSSLGSGTISLDASGGDSAISPGLNSLIFNNTTGFTINSSGTTNHIQFNTSGSNTPTLQVFAGNHILNAVSTINATTLNISIANSYSLTIHQNINDISPGSILFSGPGQIEIAPTTAARGIIIGGSFTESSGTVENTNTLSVSSGTGSRLAATSGLFINGGIYISQNSGTITGSGTGSSNESTGAGRMIINDGFISIQNNGQVNSTSGRGCAFNIGSSGITINGGIIDAINSGTATINNGTSIGCQFFSGGALVMNGGTITSTNNAAITSASPSRGCNFQASGTGLSIADTVFTQINSGTINGLNVIGCSLTSSDKTVLNSGTLTSINNGTITSGVGTRIFGNTTLTFNDGTVISNNSGTINSTSGFGAVLASNANVIINDGTVSCSNTGIINAGIGSQIRGVTTFTQNGGNLSLNNSGTVSSGTGSIGVQVVFPNIQITDGTLTLSNSGTVSNTSTNSIGAQIQATSNLTMSGGELIVSANTGNVSGTNNFGCQVQATSGIALNGGTLLNNDNVQTPIVTIVSLGNLAGKGSFSNINNAQTTQIINSGTVTPGDPGAGAASPGTLSINGNYTQSSSGTLIINFLSPSTFSQLNVLGTSPGIAQLDGNLELALSPDASFFPGDRFTIVQTQNTSGVTGSFTNIINDVSVLVPHIEYFPDHVEVFFTPTTSSFAGGFSQTMLATINQMNVSLGRRVMQLHSRIQSTPRSATNLSLNQIIDSSQLLAANGFYPRTSRINPNYSMIPSCLYTPWNFYFGPTGSIGKVFSSKNQPGSKYWVAGGTAGFDYAFSQAGIGLRLDYDHIKAHSKNWGRYSVNEAHSTLYATYLPKCSPEWAFNGMVGGGYNWYKFQRSVVMLSHSAVGTSQGGEVDALLEAEYIISNKQIKNLPQSLKITPLANLQYIYLRVGKFKEHNVGTFALQMQGQTIESLRSTLGSRFNYIWVRAKECCPSFTFSVELDVAWQREYLNKDQSVKFSPVAFNEPLSTVVVPGSGRNILLTGLDLLSTYNEKYGWEASYDFEWNHSYLNHNFYVGFNTYF